MKMTELELEAKKLAESVEPLKLEKYYFFLHLPKISGVYFHIFKQKIFYVGESVDIHKRHYTRSETDLPFSGLSFYSIQFSMEAGNKERSEHAKFYLDNFDDLFVTVLPLKPEKQWLKLVEKHLILKYKPRNNVQWNNQAVAVKSVKNN
jgi:hypothetical protein